MAYSGPVDAAPAGQFRFWKIGRDIVGTHGWSIFLGAFVAVVFFLFVVAVRSDGPNPFAFDSSPREDSRSRSSSYSSTDAGSYRLKEGPIYNGGNYISRERAEWYFGARAKAEARELLQQHGNTPNPSQRDIEAVLRGNELLERGNDGWRQR